MVGKERTEGWGEEEVAGEMGVVGSGFSQPEPPQTAAAATWEIVRNADARTSNLRPTELETPRGQSLNML